MQIRYYKEYSRYLDRFMEFKVYGHAGRPIIIFPCQSGRFYDWEDRNMCNLAAPWIDSGKLQIFTFEDCLIKTGSCLLIILCTDRFHPGVCIGCFLSACHKTTCKQDCQKGRGRFPHCIFSHIDLFHSFATIFSIPLEYPF